ncbi:MAG: MmgE/PrpD family protein, partial [Pseudomonadota bacterium]
LGVARLRGLSSEQALDAMGLALGQCSGTMQAHLEGTPALPVQIGNAARAAHLACDLAEAGLKGPHDSLEGPFGYLTLMEDAWDMAPVLSSLGIDWRIAQVSHKPFPTGRAAQGGIVLIKQLLERGLNVEKLASLELTAPPLIHRLVGRRPKPHMPVAYARLCFAYLGARCLMSGDVGLDDFSPERLDHAATLRFAENIKVVDNGDSDPAAFTPQIAKATLVDGRTISVETHALYGSPADPMNVEAQHLKIRKCIEFGFGSAREDIAEGLISRIAELEDEADVASLSQLAAGFKEA